MNNTVASKNATSFTWLISTTAVEVIAIVIFSAFFPSFLGVRKERESWLFISDEKMATAESVPAPAHSSLFIRLEINSKLDDDASIRGVGFSSTILIVGAGTWGASTALHLARRGYTNVTVLDAYRQPSKISAGNDVNKIVSFSGYKCHSTEKKLDCTTE